MERLTVNDLHKVCYDPWELCGMDKYCTKGTHEEGGCARGCHIIKMYKKLAEYEDAEEQGLLIRLPCKVGDTVYFVYHGEVAKSEVRRFYQCNGAKNWGIVLWDTYPDIYFDQFGKTVFLTKEEAEQALKEKEK